MPKAVSQSPRAQKERRHNPLSEDYRPTGPLKQKAAKRRKLKQDEREDDHYVDSKASRRILQIGQELLADEELIQESTQTEPAAKTPFAFESRSVEEQPSGTIDIQYGEDDEADWGSDEDIVEDDDVDVKDITVFNQFNPTSAAHLPDLENLLRPQTTAKTNQGEDDDTVQGTNLADLILEKIAAHEARQTGGTHPDLDQEDYPEMSPKVIEVYTTVGQLLSRHRSGPLPKPFKILPTLPTDEIPPLVLLTKPESWTPFAHFQATRLFVSSNPNTAQSYLHAILLPRVRTDIYETKKLHVHLYAALKKSLYRPACFFKGFLFPLLEGDDGACTLREAHIISSVLARVSIPVLHSAAALLRLCDIAASQFSTRDPAAGGPANVFIRTLLEKKYALPYKVIDALVFHFLRFRALEGLDGATDGDIAMQTGAEEQKLAGKNPQGQGKQLPLLWHQCLLVFAQRYRNDITEDQREALLDLVLVRGHKGIGPEVRRELLEGRGRGIPEPQPGAGDGGDDTMMEIS